MTADEMIAVIQAWKDGKKIQYQVRHPGSEAKWSDVIAVPCWDFSIHDYRVKPEPPREWWINVYGNTGEAHRSKEAADNGSRGFCDRCVHVREVLE